MEENVIEETTEETLEEETLEESDDTEDVDALKASLEKERKARQQLTARAKKAEEALKASKVESPTLSTVERRIDDEAIDLRLDGYSKDEVAFILKNGGRKALEDPYVSGAIAQRREQSKAEEESSKARDTSGATSFEKKFPKEKLDKMSAEELAKVLPHTEE